MDLWNQLVLFEQMIWVLCGVLYLIDHVALLESTQLLCDERPWGWRFRLQIYPFTIAGKDLYLLDPLQPWWGTFVLPWGEGHAEGESTSAKSDTKSVRQTRRDLLVFRQQIMLLRVVSTLSFVSLFVVGPAMTATRGLTHAVLSVVPIHVVLVSLGAVVLWRLRQMLKLPIGGLLGLLVEALICPPYAASLLKRVALHYGIEVDGVGLAKVLKPRSNFQELLARAVARLDEWDGEGEEGAGRETAARGYRSRLQSWS